MALTGGGRIYSCPYCGLGISFAFMEANLLTLQPVAVSLPSKGLEVPLTRLSRRLRMCRQCGYLPDLPEDDENNRWAKLNAARVKASPALPTESQSKLSVDTTGSLTVTAPVTVPVTPSPPAVVSTEDEAIDSLKLTDEPEEDAKSPVKTKAK